MSHLKLALCGALAAAAAAVAGPLVAVAAPNAPDGEVLFRQRCAMCHSNVATKQVPLGPNLVGVVGRKAGSTPFKHSPALTASGITWDTAKLEQYLAGPTKLVPGSKMVVSVPDAAQRAALARYLATLR
jgi:cytochrome c